MKVLDLFSGLNGWSDPMHERGHECFSIDNDLRFDADAYIDAGDADAVIDVLPWFPDLIVASPPCTSFSTMVMGRNWTHDGEAKTAVAREGLRLVAATLELIDRLEPEMWVLENPRARLRTLGVLPYSVRRETVTYCRLGDEHSRMKPTDLWLGGDWTDIVLPAMCRNGNPDHVAAPRGSYTGTQGMDSAPAAKIPQELSEIVCDAAERYYVKRRGWA